MLMGSTGCIELETKQYTANYRTMFTSEPSLSKIAQFLGGKINAPDEAWKCH